MKCDTCENKSMCKEREYLINFMHGEIADTFADNCSGYEQHEEPMTNEEWFCGLSTEEKAIWIERFMFIVRYRKEVEDGAYMQTITKKDYIEKWLKQPHSEAGK